MTKIDLAVKYVNLTPGSSFIQPLMDRSFPIFVEIGPPVPEKMFFTIYGRDGNHGHVTWTIYKTLVPSSEGGSTYNFALIGQAV